MKFEGINRKFTAIVAEWIAKGYIINSSSMGGSQGEVAKIDLTDGKEIVRVALIPFGKPCTEIDGKSYYLHGIRLVVGKDTDRCVPNTADTWNTCWTSHMEEIESESFYEIGRNRDGDRKWYGTMEEAIRQQNMACERFEASKVRNTYTFSDKAKGIVLSFVKRQPGCKSKTRADIGTVQKTIWVRTEGKRFIQYARYTVEVKTKEYTLR